MPEARQRNFRRPEPSRPAVGFVRLLLTALLTLLALSVSSASAAKSRAGRTLVFGMSAAFSGPARGLGVEYERGILAAFSHINAQGGAGGLRLALVPRDDGYGPAATLGNTIEFVERDHVFALLGYVGTPTTARMLPLLKHYDDQDVTLLFPLTGSGLLRDRAYDDRVFTLRGSYQDEASTLVRALLDSGRRRVAVFYQADVYGRDGWDGVRHTLADHGLPIVSEATYRRGARFAQSFLREAGIILAGKPDAVVMVGTAPASAAFVRDLTDLGFRGEAAALSFADADNLVRYLCAQTRVNGHDYTSRLVFSQVVPSYDDERLPAARLYRRAMAHFSPPPPPQLSPDAYEPHHLSFVGFEGFLAGMALGEAVKRLHGDADRALLRRVLSSMTSVNLGLGRPVNLHPDGRLGHARTYLAIYRGGRFIGVDGLKAVHR